MLTGMALTGFAQKTDDAPADHFDPDDLQSYPDIVTEDRAVTVRGQTFTLHFYRPQAAGPARPAIYACGDGGWRGLAPRTARQLAHIGFAVAGLDTKVYLQEFASIANPLTFRQLAADYADLAGPLRAYAQTPQDEKIFLYGWSLGAGFAVAMGADEATRNNWAGVISIGLPKQNQLVSGVNGNHDNLNDPLQSRYGFLTEKVMPLINPLPLVMIQSTSDTASPLKTGQTLFDAARGPKNFVLIKANNHRFSGGREEFYAALDNARAWIQQARNGGAVVPVRL